MTASPRIAVFGAGANGGAIAAALVEAGADVTAIDPWPAQVEAVREQGLTVRTADGARTTRLPILHLCELAEPAPQFDLIVLGVKAYDTRWACELLRPHLAAEGAVVAVQNGMTLDTVREVFGADRAIGCVIEVAANMFDPGDIEQQAPMWLALGGETPASQARAEQAARVLSPAASIVIVDDIRSAKWMKLVANSCELVPSAILDLPLAEAIALPGMHDFMLEAGHEALDAALADGRSIVPIFDGEVRADHLTRERYVEYLLGIVLSDYTLPDTLTTVLQDWRKGRRAEIEEINGTVLDVLDADRAPSNTRILELARRIERGERPAGTENLGILLDKTTDFPSVPRRGGLLE
ncbi:NAD-binding protein [Leucobacter weissii]|uniref:NAD-binding protein n=1 Tax=Leucobacter weissii TaxID=1983706 RepID=A0A939MMV8_9MICO|nr:2-dehydropantoate 2-reductase N-terminal domain-containing protein [Leucobacter weissii]MBO1901507.1 NAD-binding protein [Leucobacter weissii]